MKKQYLLFIFLLLIAPSFSLLQNKHSCESQGYTWLENSNYPGTYSFENYDSGIQPSEFVAISNGLGCTCTVNNIKSGHQKIADFFASEGQQYRFYQQFLSGAKSSGSVEFWMMSTNVTKQQKIWFTNSTSLGQTNIALYVGFWNNYIVVNQEASWDKINVIPCKNNEWYHIIVDFNCNSEYFSLSINGVKYGNYRHYYYATQSVANVTHLTFKADDNGEFHTYIDSLSYSWDPDYHIGDNLMGGCCGDDVIDLRNGLVSEWHFDENSGSTPYDNISSNPATLVNSPSFVTGKFGKALNLTGNEYGNLVQSESLDFSNLSTFSVWIKTSQSTIGSIFRHVSGVNAYGDNVLLRINSGKVEAGMKDYALAWHFLMGTSLINDNQWHLAVSTYDNNVLKVYVDGKLEAVSTPFQPQDFGASNWTIGRYGLGTQERYVGVIDDLRVYNKPLTDREVQYLYGMSAYSYTNYADTFYNGTINVDASYCVNNDFYTRLEQSSKACNDYGFNYLTKDWLDEGFKYRKNITITNSGTQLTDYQVAVNPSTYNTTGLVASYHFSDEGSSVKDYSGNNNHGSLYGSTVGLWHFDEGAGTSAYDSTIYNNNGTITGAVFNSAGIFGKSLSFDGVDDYVDLGNPASLQLTGNITLAGWIKTTDSDGVLVAKGYDGTNTAYGIRTITGGYATLWVYTASTEYAVSSKTPINDNTWHQVVGTISADKVFSIYVDGILQASELKPVGVQTSTRNVGIGARIEGSAVMPLNGTVDEVAIYNKPLSADEVKSLYYSKKAKFIEYQEGYESKGSGLIFDGVSNNVDLGNIDAPIEGKNNFTLSLWINPKTVALNNYKAIMGTHIGSGYNTGWDLTLNVGAQGAVGFIADDVAGSPWGISYIASANLASNEWVHIVLTRNGNTFQFYKNGAAIGSPNTNSLTIGSGAYNLKLGTSGNERYFDGSIDEVLIYNRALTTQEISDLYSESRGRLDYADLRFYNSSGNELNYYQEYDNTSWVKVPSIPAGNSNITMYYGNPGASSKSNGELTFDFFDDFNFLDNSKWFFANHGSGASYKVTSGVLYLASSNNLAGSATANTNKKFANNFIIEWERKDNQENYNDLCFGYGAVTAINGNEWWHTATEYGYCNYIQSNSNYFYEKRNGATAQQLQVNIDGPDIGAWNKYSSVYNSTGFWGWYNNLGNILGTGQTDTSYLSNEKYILLSRGGYSGGAYGGISSINWLRSRKYAFPEPTTSAQPEESIYGNSNGLLAYYSFDNDINNKTEDSIGKNHGSLFGSTVGLWRFDDPYYSPRDSTSYSNNGGLKANTVAVWHFDEGSGTAVKDESGYTGGSGSFVNMESTDWIQGVSGNAIVLDGVNEYVQINSGNSLGFNSNITVSAWIKTNTVTGDQSILARYYSPSLQSPYILKLSGDEVRGYVSSSWSSALMKTSNSANLVPGQWYHVAFTYTLGSTDMKLYVNGVEVVGTVEGQGAQNSLMTGDIPMFIGSVRYSDNFYEYFNGVIDEVSVYKTALTASQIADLYYSNKAKFIEYASDAKSGSALTFDGNNDLVTVPDSSSLDFVNTPFTISLWINKIGNSVRNEVQLIHKESGVNPYGGYNLWIDSSTQKVNFRIRDSSNGASTYASTNTISAGWNHVLVSYNLTGVSVYINNQPDYFAATRVIGATTSVLSIGDVSGGGIGYAINGSIDELAIYNKSLARDEVTYLYNSQKAEFMEHAEGKNGKGINFDGKTTKIVVNDSDSLDLTNSLTLSAWVYAKGYALGTGPDYKDIILSKGDDVGGGGSAPYYTSYILEIFGNSGTNAKKAGFRVTTTTQNTITAFSNQEIQLNEWYLITGVYNGSHEKIYINGALDNIQALSGSFSPSSKNLSIGWCSNCLNLYNYTFNGSVDDVRIYNRALSDAEVSELYSLTFNNYGCCGNDYNTDTFYNGSLSSTNNFCHFGSYIPKSLEHNSTLCSYYNYLWFEGSIGGNSTIQACCGDDGASDNFYNDSIGSTNNFCQEGAAKIQWIDSSQATCEHYGYTWIDSRAGLVGYYKFDELSGSSVADSSSNNNVGTIYGSTPRIPGKSGTALSFSNSSTYVSVPHSDSLNISSNITISFWIKTSMDCSGGWRGIIHKKSDPYDGSSYLVRTGSGNLYFSLFGVDDSNNNAYFPCSNFNNNEWHHVAVLYNSSQIATYLDGALKSISSKPNISIKTNTDPLRINYNFVGLLDEVQIFNKALTDSEIKAIYNYNVHSCCGDDKASDNFYNSSLACVKGSSCSEDLDYGADNIYGTSDDSCSCSNEETFCLFSQNYNFFEGQCISNACQVVSPFGAANLIVKSLNYTGLYSNSLSEIKIYVKNMGSGVGIISGINMTGIDISSIDYNPNVWPDQEALILIKTFTPCSIEGIVKNFNFTIYYADTEAKTLESEVYEILTANPLSLIFLSNHKAYAVLQLSTSAEERIEYFVKNNGLSNINLSASIQQSESIFSTVVTFTGEFYPSEINKMSFALPKSGQLFFSNQLYPIMSGLSGQYSENLEDNNCEFNKLALSYEYSIVSQTTSGLKVMVADEKTVFELILGLFDRFLIKK